MKIKKVEKKTETGRKNRSKQEDEKVDAIFCKRWKSCGCQYLSVYAKINKLKEKLRQNNLFRKIKYAIFQSRNWIFAY